MDPSRFDRLARGLAGISTRRGTLLGLLGGLTLPLLPDDETDARNKHTTSNRNKNKGQKGRRNGRNVSHGDGHQRNRNNEHGRSRGRQPDRNHVESEKKKKKKKCKPPTAACGKACVDVSSDAANCGACGQVCATGQACQGGTCTCNGVRCTGCCDGTTCQAGTSDQFCGAAGAACTACTGGRTCQGGTCTCAAGESICSEVCVDTQSNGSHCGACGTVCSGTTKCQGGACTCGADDVCGAGETCCLGACRNIHTSLVACGDCETACDAQKADQCVGGVCQCGGSAACGDGQTCCGGVCKTLSTDAANCGTCGNQCPSGETCQNGACKCGSGATCGTGKTCCSGTCRDLATAFVACGSCTSPCSSIAANQCVGGNCRCGGSAPCGTGQTCCNGTCCATASCCNNVCCPVGWTCCSGVCKFLSTDMTNCGTCGANCTTLYGTRINTCSGGACKCGTGAACAPGFTCCGGVCKDLNSDISNCGICGKVCPGVAANTNITCSFGNCGFTCKGLNFDVNHSAADGCEVVAPDTRGTQNSAYYLGNLSCDDDSRGGFDGVIVSDARIHDPGILGFDARVGTAPQWWRVFADGGFDCQNDPDITINQWTGTDDCYQLTFLTDGGTWSVPVQDGFGRIFLGSGAYPDDSNVYFKVEKTCGNTVRESMNYSVRFHL